MMKNYYVRRMLPFFLLAAAIELVEFVLLVCGERSNVDWRIVPLVKTLGVFVVELIVSFAYWMIPYFLYLVFLPQKQHGSKADRIVTISFFSLFAFVSIFEDVAEGFFWNEFTASFNFIAVDYLVYTKEVIGNIYQSYPIIPIVLGVIVASVAAVWLARKYLIPDQPAPLWKIRLCWAVGVVALCSLSFFAYDGGYADGVGNRYNAEIAKDGQFHLFSAFLKNELSYQDYYLTIDEQEIAPELRQDLQQPGVQFVSTTNDSIARTIPGTGCNIRPNVMIVVMESMGSEFFPDRRNDGQILTPNLAELGKNGLFFPNTYATGTRSVRGLEAVSTSIPPLPGMAILRRDGNENLQTIGSIFAAEGYDDRKWIYGGYGYFDNMNAYFAGNGFEVLDRTSMPNEEITHATVWGVCDEDLFRRCVQEADRSFARGKPFLQFVFTTSNHRPYTYPEGKIDIPSKTGRLGAVKYADYAVGELMRVAKTKPWFDDTVFVFVADHGAGSAGKKELNPEAHLIPCIIYSPKLVHPEFHPETISQIDVLPTLLGVLGWNYTTSFYGKDARRKDYKSRYFLSNYQCIGYAEGDDMVILKPVRELSFYRGGNRVERPDQKLRALQHKAICYYQHASHWRKHLAQKQQIPNLEQTRSGDRLPKGGN